eukprot:11179523-Lingulodinium_polyedra.AAC.1
MRPQRRWTSGSRSAPAAVDAPSLTLGRRGAGGGLFPTSDSEWGARASVAAAYSPPPQVEGTSC